MSDYNVNVADLRDRITFQSPTVTTDAGAAQVPSWANVATNPTVWSKWVHDHGQELLQSDAGKSQEQATVTVRYRNDINSAWAVLDASGSRWQIISPPENVQNLNRWTVFRVERVKGTV
jgi:SPP1 family predicted phage head-tail adaptor